MLPLRHDPLKVPLADLLVQCRAGRVDVLRAEHTTTRLDGIVEEAFALQQSKDSWVQRAQAYDSHCERLERAARDAKVKELIDRRMDWELKAQNDMEDMVGLMRGKLEKLIEFPPTSIEQVKYNDAGEVVSKYSNRADDRFAFAAAG